MYVCMYVCVHTYIYIYIYICGLSLSLPPDFGRRLAQADSVTSRAVSCRLSSASRSSSNSVRTSCSRGTSYIIDCAEVVAVVTHPCSANHVPGAPSFV